MKKYGACFGRVKPIEVQRETKESVWIGGQRRSKGSNWRPLFDTEREAWAYIVREAQNALLVARARVEAQERDLDAVWRRVPPALFPELRDEIAQIRSEEK